MYLLISWVNVLANIQNSLKVTMLEQRPPKHLADAIYIAIKA